MFNTRFNPTTSGPLHIGHIFTLLVNETFAHESGGKFYVRFDDTSQAINIEMEHPERVEAIIRGQKKDIEWLGVPVDDWQEQHNSVGFARKTIMSKLPLNMFEQLRDPYPHVMPYSVRMGSSWIPYPYAPYQTAERVVMDYELGITHVIRGEDFLTEYSLYRYFCDLFDYEPPKFIFLPRLCGRCGDISKTNGGYTIKELKGNGYTPDDIKNLLKKACLNWAENGWTIHNLKPNPRVDL